MIMIITTIIVIIIINYPELNRFNCEFTDLLYFTNGLLITSIYIFSRLIDYIVMMDIEYRQLHTKSII